MNIYQIFIRNLTKEGTFKAAQQDLKRIASMGFKVIYLMPFHPISKLNRKGTYGSPYAIADYYGVSEDLGTLDDVRSFLDEAHRLGLEVIMDIVFNHAGADHHWTIDHPDYFLLDEEGQPTRKVADWSDIVDYNFENQDLLQALKEVLMYWAQFGFDGFRCDVAPIIPYGFWLEAVSQVCGSYPKVKWYSESLDHNFLKALRLQGETVMSDLDILRLFDGSYDYDIWNLQKEVMKDRSRMDEFVTVLNYRYAQNLKDKVKWHFIENHDQIRLRNAGMSRDDYLNWLAFVLFQSGMGFVYQGMETTIQPEVSFFEKQVINRDFDDEIVHLIKEMNQLKSKWMSEGEVYQEFFYEDEVLSVEVTTKTSAYTLSADFGAPRPVNHDKIKVVRKDRVI